MRFPIVVRFAAVLLCTAVAPAWSQSNGPAMQPYSATPKAAETLLLAPGVAPEARVELGPMDTSAIDAVKRANAASFAKRLQIGIGRAVKDPAASSEALQWAPLSGGMAAQWKIRSPDARALRVSLVAHGLDDRAQVRVAGNDAPERVYGPFTAAELQAHSTWVSPVLEGDTATVEVFVPGAAAPPRGDLAVAQVSHLFVSPADPKAESLAKIGESGSCEVDLICRAATDASLAQAGKAVARMTFSDAPGSADTFLCTGTLLNPTGGAGTPYFYSANHCISTQDSADTLATDWFYDAAACGSTAVNPSYVQLPGGATLLFANQSSDGLLLRLKNAPPGGAVLAAWDAASLTSGAALTAIHHPMGDVKKVSLGTMGGFGSSGDTLANGSFIVANWNSTATGVTEPGSSGSGIFTGSASSGYRFRGGLLGGPSSCSATAADLHDYYSRFDQIYPYIAIYLDPASNSCSFSFSSGSAQAGASGGSGSFGVSTQPGCTWATTSTVSWITAASTGSGAGTASYTVAANGDTAARAGTVLVGNQAFTVTQAAEVDVGTNILANPGFESGGSSWTDSGEIITNDVTLAHAGSWYAWLGGYESGNDVLYQAVTIPGNATTAQVRFWYRIDTAESPTRAFDTMTVSIDSTSGAHLATLATLSNVDNTHGAWNRTAGLDVSAFKGQTVRLTFTAVTDSTNITSFRVDDVSLAITTPGAANYTALWWNANESGWGLNVNQQGDTVFATLFTYDETGAPMWLVASNAARQSGDTFGGPLYRTTGPVPVTSSANIEQVGTLSVSFSSAAAGTLTYSYHGTTVAKAITKQVFGSRAATCVGTTADRSSLTNYQDLWWKGLSENGWGLNLTHQDNTLFATLFTYDAANKGMWLVMSNGARQSDGSYMGDLFVVTHGSAFNAQPVVPIGPSNYRKVGAMQLQFSSGTSGTLTYSVDGVTAVKSITRQVFGSSPPACS